MAEKSRTAGRSKQTLARRSRKPSTGSSCGDEALLEICRTLEALRRDVGRIADLLGARARIGDYDFSTLEAPRALEQVARAAGFADLFPFGLWHSDDADQRWAVDFNDNGCAWTERTRSGAALNSRVELRKDGAGWRIERANDATVLGFLGASPTVIGEILPRNPKPSFIKLSPDVATIRAEWNGLRWTLTRDGHLETLEQPGTSPATITQYTLTRHGNDEAWYQVQPGQFTFDQEGTEGGAFHSRWLHWPGGASGLTLGRGYDMRKRTAADVAKDLKAVGVVQSLATSFAAGAGLSGDAAKLFRDNHRTEYGNITPGQQQRLFKTVYAETEAEVRRLCKLHTVVDEYGAVDFATLDGQIWTILVDLKFRGDYTRNSRKFIQAHVAKNDFVSFKKALQDRSNWPSVPQARFAARSAFLNGSIGAVMPDQELLRSKHRG